MRTITVVSTVISALFLIGGSAMAQSESPAPAGAEAAKPAAATEAKPAAETKRTAAAKPARAKPAMSHSAFVQRLASSIRGRTPGKTALGPGTAQVSFRIGANGRATSISANGSSPAHAALAKRIIAGVQAPPPPEGSFAGNQEFRFR